MDYLLLDSASTHSRIGGRMKTVKTPAVLLAGFNDFATGGTPAALRTVELA